MQAAARTAQEEKRRKAEEAKAKKDRAAEEKRRRNEEAKAKAQAKRKEAADRNAAAARAKQAQAAERAAKPGATISLFGLGQETDAEPSAPSGAKSTAKAPRGVPTIIKWKRRNDGK